MRFHPPTFTRVEFLGPKTTHSAEADRVLVGTSTVIRKIQWVLWRAVFLQSSTRSLGRDLQMPLWIALMYKGSTCCVSESGFPNVTWGFCSDVCHCVLLLRAWLRHPRPLHRGGHGFTGCAARTQLRDAKSRMMQRQSANSCGW